MGSGPWSIAGVDLGIGDPDAPSPFSLDSGLVLGSVSWPAAAAREIEPSLRKLDEPDEDEDDELLRAEGDDDVTLATPRSAAPQLEASATERLMDSSVTAGESASRKLRTSGFCFFAGGWACRDTPSEWLCDNEGHWVSGWANDAWVIVDPLPLELPDPFVFVLRLVRLVSVETTDGDLRHLDTASSFSSDASSP